MPAIPIHIRAITFFDGQNLYHCAREAFGFHYPNYDVTALSRYVCAANAWELKSVRFYTGYPSAQDGPFWHAFWQKKLLAIARQGAWKFSRPLRYRTKTFKLDNDVEIQREVGEEKGIDVRIALDLVRLARNDEYDVAVIFSQDQDLSEAVNEVREISIQQNRWIKVASAYPYRDGLKNGRGINGTQWIKLDRAAYEQCIDPVDYR